MQQGTTRYKSDKPLDRLQSMVNGVLVEIGNVLRTANTRGSDSLAHGNPRLQMTIPPVIDNFHLALDQIECDIVRARAVINRDLLRMRSNSTTLNVATSQDHESTRETNASTVTINGKDEHQTQDIHMSDPGVDESVPIAKQETITNDEPTPAVIELGAPTATIVAMKEESTPSSTSPTSTLPATSTAIPPEHVHDFSTPALPSDGPPEVSSVPQKSDTMDLDLDSMFGLNDSLQNETNGATANQLSDDQDMTFSLNYGSTEGLDLASFGEVDDTKEDVTAMLESLGGFTNTNLDETEHIPVDSSENTNIMANISQPQALENDDLTQLDFAMDGTDTALDAFDLNFDFGGGIDDGTDDLDNMEHGEFDDMFFGAGNGSGSSIQCA